LKQMYPGHAAQVMALAAQCTGGVRVSGHRRNLFFGASDFGQTPCGGLAQSVRDAPLRKTGGLYCVGHHVAKSGDAKGLTENGG
jgi:hypothetical protein